MIPPPDLWGSTGYVANNNKEVEEETGEGWSKVCSARSQELEEELVRQRVARKWYLVVIVLLYVGLLASFSLNVTLLLRKPPPPPPIRNDNQVSHLVPTTTPLPSLLGEFALPGQRGFAYTTPCLVTVPCEAGHLYDCSTSSCQRCPAGSYQPQWGQTACWPCPPNTTTDEAGSMGLQQCKRQECPFYTKEGVGIMESPNYPAPFPASSSCRWRVSPGHTRRVLLLLPRLALPPDCSASLTITRADTSTQEGTTVLSTCVSTDRPTILTGQAASLSVEFRAGGHTSDTGFQLTALSIEEELGYLVDAIINSGEISTFPGQGGSESLSQDDKILLSRLLLLLNPSYQPSSSMSSSSSSSSLHHNKENFHNPVRHKKPIIEVLEDSPHSTHNRGL